MCPWRVLAFASMTTVLKRLWNTLGAVSTLVLLLHFFSQEGFHHSAHNRAGEITSPFKHFCNAFTWFLVRTLTWPVVPHCITFDFADEHKHLLWDGKQPNVVAWESSQVPLHCSPPPSPRGGEGQAGREGGRWKWPRRREEAQLKKAQLEAWNENGEYEGRNRRVKQKGFKKGDRKEVEIRSDPF